MSNTTPINPLNISSHITAATRSRTKTSFEFVEGKWQKKDKANQDVYKEVKGAPEEAIAVELVEDEQGQKLQFTYSNSLTTKGEPKIVASFNLLSNMTLEWNVDPEFDKDQKRISMAAFSGLVIKSGGLSELFVSWLTNDEFVDHSKTMASRLVYPPKLMKMILLWLAYIDIRATQGWTEGQQLFDDMNVSLDKVGQKFKQMILDFVGNVDYMLPYYTVPETFRLYSPGELPQLQPAESESAVDIQSEESIPEIRESVQETESQVTTLEPLPDNSLPVGEVTNSTQPEVTPEPKEEPKSNKRK